MLEHVKRFDGLNAADGHVIAAPFISVVDIEGSDPVLISCDQEGKKLEVSNGMVNVVDDVRLIRFKIDGVEYQAEEGMTLHDWCLSDYNTGGFSEGIVKGWGGITDGNDNWLVFSGNDPSAWD